MITIYLAEDQVMIAQALQTLLDLEADLKVLGVANDGQQALKDILELKPDIALLDIETPHLNGLDVATQLRESVWSGKVIVLTTFARKEYFAKAVENEVVNPYIIMCVFSVVAEWMLFWIAMVIICHLLILFSVSPNIIPFNATIFACSLRNGI